MPPVVIAGGIAAAGAVGAAAIGAKGAKSAAKTTQQGTDASLAVQERTYGQNQAALAPWQQSGLQANSLLMNALGFGQPATQSDSVATGGIAGAQPGMLGSPANALAGGNGYTANGTNRFAGTQPLSLSQLADYQQNPNAGAYVLQQQQQQQQQAPVQTAGAPGTPNAQNAFDTFLNSTNYRFQLGQGLNAVNSGYAGAGTLQSGAAMKAINDYAQNTAQGAYQGWLGNIGDIANRGFGAASAQAGVGQNFANSVSALNSANANAQAGYQIARANSLGSALGGIGAIGANVLGSVLAPTAPNAALYGSANALINANPGIF